jgi:hypothetical protein
LPFCPVFGEIVTMHREIITGRGRPWGYAGRLVPTSGRRGLDYVEALARRLKPVYEQAELDVRDFAIATTDEVWPVLVRRVRDRKLASELRAEKTPWHSDDRDDLVRHLRGRRLRARRTVFWTFTRGASRMTASVLEHPDWTDVVIDRDDRQYRRERFPRYNRLAAAARASLLGGQLRKTSWREITAA